MGAVAKTRILYGVHGYGRGHAARAQAMLPELARRYEMLVLAGDDAYDQLRGDWPVVRIPALRYYADRKGRRSALRTIQHNLPGLIDLWLAGPGLQMVAGEMRRFGPAVVISDSEGWTHRAARRLGIPRISFDHYGVLVHGRLDMPAFHRLVLWCESRLYHFLTCRPDRVIAAAFFPAEPRRDNARIVGPIIRNEARRIEPTRGEHVLAYFTNARDNFTPAIENALRQADGPVRIYGPRRTGREGNLDFRPIANEPFLMDLASCRAVVATAGNQLISEAIHFGKPVLTIPEDALEQRLNARTVAEWKIGMEARPHRLPVGLLREFLARLDEFAANIPGHRRDGVAETVAAIDEAVGQLTGKAQGAPKTRKREPVR